MGLIAETGYFSNDIMAYLTNSGLPNTVRLTNVLVDGFNGLPSTNVDNTEISMDIEMAISWRRDSTKLSTTVTQR